MAQDLQYTPGTPEFQAKIASLRGAVFDAIPSAIKLSTKLLANLPTNVMAIPVTCGLLTAEELAITDLDAVGVRDCIASGEITSVQATTAFAKRAGIAHQLTYCLSDFFLDEALERAEELDKIFKETGKLVGPLHGVPIAIKDHMPVKGRLGSAGYLSTLEVAKEDGVQVAILRNAGAVFYCKTNQPQGVMHLESHSFWGRTLNPYNTLLSPGGSSGGSSALIAMKGATLIPGTDIGGSIRNPCAMTGIYGMKPTSQTFPIGGHMWYQGGYSGVWCSTGPMCASQRDVSLFMEVVLGARPYLIDPQVFPTSFAPPDISGKQIRIGVMRHDGHVVPHPPILRGLDYVVKAISSLPNVTMVDYKPFQHDTANEIIRELYFPEGRANVEKILAASGEAMLPLTSFILGKNVKDHSMEEYFALTEKRETYREAHLKHWMASEIDVLLCPATQSTANPHDTATYWPYTSQWNLTDYPGFVFPTGLYVDPAIDGPVRNFEPLTVKDTENHKTYDPELMKGSPIAVQLVARKFDDNLLISVQRLIEKALRG